MAKVLYKYGSPPQPGYSYLHFVQHLAPRLPVDDHVFLHERAMKWRKNRSAIPFELFKNVCYWKSPRRFKLVQRNTQIQINNRWHAALTALGVPPFTPPTIVTALNELTKLEGVGVPTASALLTAWNSNHFGIMDFKTLSVLGMSLSDSAAAYVRFRNRLLQLKTKYPALAHCALRQIELALWHYYPINLSRPKERPQ